jgi:hypothetical protein
MTAKFLIQSAAYLLGAESSDSEAPLDACSTYAQANRGMVDREIAALLKNVLEQHLAELQPGAQNSRSPDSADPAPTVCASTNEATSSRRTPVNIEVRRRASGSAGFANEAEQVNQ